MREIKEKNNWPMYSLLLVLICISFGILFIGPFVQSVKESKTQIAAKEIEKRELEGKLNSLTQIQNTLSSDTNIATNLALALPEGNEISEILETLNAISNQTVTDLTLIKQSTNKNETQTSIDLSFDASYTSFKMFLEDLENNLRLVTPTKIGLVSTKNSVGGETYLKGNMTVDFFKTNSESESSKEAEGLQ